MEADNQIIALLFLHSDSGTSVGRIQLHGFLLGGILKFNRYGAFAQFRIQREGVCSVLFEPDNPLDKAGTGRKACAGTFL